MRIRNFFKLTAFLVLVALTATRLPAQLIYVSNTGNTVNYGIALSSSTWLAQPFTTGTNPLGYTFNSASLKLGQAGTPTPYSVSLYNNNSTQPGTSFDTLGTVDNLNFTATGVDYLAPSTTYWLVMSTSNPNSNPNYEYTSITFNHSYTSTGGWSVPGAANLFSSSNSGVSWSDFGSPSLFSVTATAAVPEPSAYLLAGLGLMTLLFVCARRKA